MSIEQFWSDNKRYRNTIFADKDIHMSRFWLPKYKSLKCNKFEDIEYTYPTDPSRLRDTGYALWDIISNYNNSFDMRRSITVNHKSVTPLKEQSHQNYVWCDDAYTSKRKNYTDTDQPIAHLDFNTTINGIYGFELYEAAHVLTHMWADPQSN